MEHVLRRALSPQQALRCPPRAKWRRPKDDPMLVDMFVAKLAVPPAIIALY